MKMIFSLLLFSAGMLLLLLLLPVISGTADGKTLGWGLLFISISVMIDKWP